MKCQQKFLIEAKNNRFMSLEHFAILLNGFIWFLTFLRGCLKYEIFRTRRECGSYLSRSLPDEGISNTNCPPLPSPTHQNSFRMWWLILCVSLSEFKDAQRAGKMWHWSVFVKVFLKEICIWIGRLNKEYCPPMWVLINDCHHLICEGPGENRKIQEECIFKLHLLKLGHPSSPVFWLWCSGTLDSDWIMSQVFLVVQLANGRWWNFSASVITWAKSYTKSRVCVCLCVWYITYIYKYAYMYGKSF